MSTVDPMPAIGAEVRPQNPNDPTTTVKAVVGSGLDGWLVTGADEFCYEVRLIVASGAVSYWEEIARYA